MSTGTEAPAPEPPPGEAPTLVPGRDALTRPLPELEEAPRGVRLATRMALTTAALLAGCVALAVVLATRQAEQVTERRIAQRLLTVPVLFANYEVSAAAARRQQVRSLADQAGTKALLGEADVGSETLSDSARDFARSLGAAAVTFFDRRGVLLARGDLAPGEERGRDFSGVSWVKDALAGSDGSAYVLELRRARRLLLVAAAPVSQGEGRELQLNGVLAAAFAVGDAQAREVGVLLQAETAVVANVAAREEPPRLAVVASTPALREVDFHGRLSAAGAVEALFARGQALGRLDFAAGDERFIATALPLRSGGGEPIAALVVARSREAELATFHQIRRGLLAAGLVVFVLSVPVSLALARHVSRPIERLAAAASAIREGRLDLVLPMLPRSGGDEVGILTRTFRAMVVELKEKAALEEWVAETLRRPGDVTVGGRGSGGAADTPEGLAVGRLFARRYDVLSVLGQGGMGTVFRVHDRELDADVALKVLRAAPGPEAVQVLRQEMRLARLITHPHVVRAYDVGEADGVRFLTMEYVPGTTLSEVLERRGPLDLAPGLQMAKQVCRGLAAVHKAGVVHGDLKPRNVMVMASGVVKLMDFGVAHGLRSGADPAGVGSPHYMAPEQIKGGDTDPRTDIYALGVTLFEAFTGRRPFEADDVSGLLRKQLYDGPPRPSAFRSGLPEMLEQAILSCLAKAKAQRPSSAEALERLLLRVRVG